MLFEAMDNFSITRSARCRPEAAGAARTTVPQIYSPTLYHCAKLTHDTNVKLLIFKNAFRHSNMANIYEVQVHIPTNISIKKSIFYIVNYPFLLTFFIFCVFLYTVQAGIDVILYCCMDVIG